VGISTAERLALGSVVTKTKVDFEELYAFASRANTAYATEATIRSSYPATVRVSTPGKEDVLYFLEQNDRTRTQYIAVRGTVDKRNFSEDVPSPYAMTGQSISRSTPGSTLSPRRSTSI
jgi:hypothetical protein